MGIFEHITALFSFVYALALTHVLMSVAELATHRDRVRPSGLQFVWMLITVALLYLNWLQVWDLHNIAHWNVGRVTVQLVYSAIQYFCCAFVSPRMPEHGELDLEAFRLRQRPLFLGAMLVLLGFSLFGNYSARDAYIGASAPNFVSENLASLLAIPPVVIAMFARRRWLAWLAALSFLALIVVFGVTFSFS